MKNSNYLEQREKDTKGLTKIKQSYFETNDYDPTPNPTPPQHPNHFLNVQINSYINESHNIEIEKKMWEILHLSWPTTPGKDR